MNMQITVNMNRFVFSLYIVCLVHAQAPQNCVKSMAVNDIDTGGSHLAKMFDITEVEQNQQRQQLEQQQLHQQQLQQQHHHHMRHGHTRVHHNHNHHHPHHHRTPQQPQPQQQLQVQQQPQQQQHHTHHHHNTDADHFVDAGNHNDVMDHESGHTQPNMVNLCHKQNNRSEIAVT